MYFYSRLSETERADNLTKNREYSINLVGYLGLTNYLTLKTRLFVYPSQKTYWYSRGGEGNDKNNFNINPELTLSYRPLKNLEIYGQFDYHQYERIMGPYSYYIDTLVGFDPETGVAIYEPRLVTTQDESVYDHTNCRFSFGLTYSGKLW